MSRVFVTSCILTSDLNTDVAYVLSEQKDTLRLPTFQVVSPRLLMNEIRYNIFHMFEPASFSFMEEIMLSHLEIQNEFLLSYISNLKDDRYDMDQDMFILNGVILSKQETQRNTNLGWKSFSHDSPEIRDSPIMAMLDMSIYQKP